MADITFDKNRKKYQVRATINGQRKYVGRYQTIREAHEAYFDAIRDINTIMLEYIETPPTGILQRMFTKLQTMKLKRDRKKQLEKQINAHIEKKLEAL